MVIDAVLVAGEICGLVPKAWMHKMLRLLFDLLEGTVPQLLAALASGDLADIHSKAHTLKGIPMLLGLQAMAKTSAQTEQPSKDASGPRLPGVLSEQLLLFETVAPGVVKHAG
jgi:HPt (histidine-containing phosphotransfer) domain-containing protein